MSAWKAISVVGGILLVSGFYAQVGQQGRAGGTCSTIADSSIGSPNRTYRVHIMNQYCAPGFGIGNNPYWVVIGDDVARTSETEDMTLAKEDEVAFKTFDFAPTVSWENANHLVIELHHVTTIAKSLHAIGDVQVSYKIAENLSEANYLKEQRAYEAKTLSDIKDHKVTLVGDPEEDIALLKKQIFDDLNNYRTFQAWAKKNAE